MGSRWASFKLSEVCTKIGSGATPRGGSEVYLERGPFSLIRSQNVYNNGFTKQGLAYIDEKAASDLSNVEVLPEDILLNITGDSVARVCQVPQDVLPARVNQHVTIIRPDRARLNPRFLRYWLSSPSTQALLLTWASAGATRNALTKGMIESIVVHAPEDIHEQEAIAHILGTFDDKIELNRKMNETLESIARALFKSWFIDFDPVRAKMEGRWKKGQSLPGLPAELFDLFPDSMKELETRILPSSWLLDRIDSFFILSYGKSLPSEKRSLGEVPVYGSGGLSGFHNVSLVNRPTIIVGRKGTVGSLYWEEQPCFPIDTVFFVESSLPLTFCFFLLESLPLRDMNTDAAVPGLNRENVYRLPFPRPSAQIIDAFDRTARIIRARLVENLKETTSLIGIRDSLLPKLVAGKLAIRNVHDFLKGRGL